VARVWPSYDNTETAYYCISGCVGDFPQSARQRRDEQGIYSKRLSRDYRAKSDVLNYTKAHRPTRLDKTVLSRRVWRCELSITWFPKVPFQNLLSPPISAERKLSGNPGAQKSQQRQAGDSGARQSGGQWDVWHASIVPWVERIRIPRADEGRGPPR